MKDKEAFQDSKDKQRPGKASIAAPAVPVSTSLSWQVEGPAGPGLQRWPLSPGLHHTRACICTSGDLSVEIPRLSLAPAPVPAPALDPALDLAPALAPAPAPAPGGAARPVQLLPSDSKGLWGRHFPIT